MQYGQVVLVDNGGFFPEAPNEQDVAWFLMDAMHVLNTDAAIRSLKSYATEKDIVVDKVWMAKDEDYEGGPDGMVTYYTRVLKSLLPGLNCILLHAAYDDAEMQAITERKGGFGSTWRQADFNFFTSDECRRMIREEHIQLITWREIKNALLKN